MKMFCKLEIEDKFTFYLQSEIRREYLLSLFLSHITLKALAGMVLQEKEIKMYELETKKWSSNDSLMWLSLKNKKWSPHKPL